MINVTKFFKVYSKALGFSMQSCREDASLCMEMPRSFASV